MDLKLFSPRLCLLHHQTRPHQHSLFTRDKAYFRFCVLGPELNFFIISAPPQTRSSPMSKPFYPYLFCKHQQAILNMSIIKIIFNFYVTMFVWTFTAGCFLAPSLRATAMNNELCFKELTVSRSSSRKREGCWVLRKGAIRTGD